MKIRYGIIGLMFSMAWPLTLADTYQYEGAIDYLQTESDFNDTDLTTLSGTYYWRPVDLDNVPLSEAAFISQASRISVGVERRSVNTDLVSPFSGSLVPNLIPPAGNFMPSILPPAINAPTNISGVTPVSFSGALPVQAVVAEDVDTFSIAGEYVTQTGWIAGLGYARSADDSATASMNSRTSRDSEVERVRLTVGKYIRPMTSVTFEYVNLSNEFYSRFESPGQTALPVPPLPPNVFSFPSTESDSDSTVDSYSLKAKTLLRRRDFTHKFEVSIGYDAQTSRFTSQLGTAPATSFTGKSHSKRWGFGYAFYPRNDIEIDLRFSSLDQDVGDQDNVSLSLEWFIKPRLAMRASYVATDTNSSFLDSDGFGIGVTGRL